MSIKLKVLGLGLLAVLATSAFAAVNASAITNGHFTAEPPPGDDHVILRGTDAFGSSHQLVFEESAGGGAISCTDAKYHGTLTGVSATTSTEVSLTPTYEKCATTSGEWGSVTVSHEAGCGTNVFKFTSRTPNEHGTVHVECVITISHPNCTIKIPKQTPSGGIVYTTALRNGVHDITGNVTVTNIIGNFEGGICIFLGTSGHTYKMTGNTTLWGESTIGNPVGITAT